MSHSCPNGSKVPGTGIAKIVGTLLAIILCSALFIPTAWLAAPRLEGNIAPIIRPSFVAGSVMRNERALCWNMDFVKRRAAIPVYINFFVVDGRNRIPLAAYKPSNGPLLSTFGFADHQPGTSWTSRYCAQLPPTIRQDSLTIEGVASYQTWNPLWRVEQAMPIFEVPGLN